MTLPGGPDPHDKREGDRAYAARPGGARRCECVKNHVPAVRDDEAEGHHVWPIGAGGPDRPENMRWLCGNTHNSVHVLWRLYERHHGHPPAEVLRTFRRYVRDLVADGWAQATATERSVS